MSEVLKQIPAPLLTFLQKNECGTFGVVEASSKGVVTVTLSQGVSVKIEGKHKVGSKLYFDGEGKLVKVGEPDKAAEPAKKSSSIGTGSTVPRQQKF